MSFQLLDERMARLHLLAGARLAGLAVAVGAATFAAGCGGGGGGAEPAPADGGLPLPTIPADEAPPASPTSPGEAPSEPGEAETEPAGPAYQLSGTWDYVGNNANEYSAYEFSPDGTFSFYSRFYLASAIDIVERGRFRIDGDTLHVEPSTKLYNGSPMSAGLARAYRWTVEADAGRGHGRLLTLTLDGEGIANQYHMD